MQQGRRGEKFILIEYVVQMLQPSIEDNLFTLKRKTLHTQKNTAPFVSASVQVQVAKPSSIHSKCLEERRQKMVLQSNRICIDVEMAKWMGQHNIELLFRTPVSYFLVAVNSCSFNHDNHCSHTLTKWLLS